MTNQEMKLLHERMKKEDPKLLVLMEKCFDAGVLSGKEQAQRTWVSLTDKKIQDLWRSAKTGANATHSTARKFYKAIEAELKEMNP